MKNLFSRKVTYRKSEKLKVEKLGRSKVKDVKGRSGLINICKMSPLQYVGILFGILLESLVDQLLNFCLLRSDPRSELWSEGLVIITCLLVHPAVGEGEKRRATIWGRSCGRSRLWKITVFMQGDWQGNEWGVDNCGLSEAPS